MPCKAFWDRQGLRNAELPYTLSMFRARRSKMIDAGVEPPRWASGVVFTDADITECVAESIDA